MKAIIEESNGLYIVRIQERNGSLCDIYVVDEIELKTCEQDGILRPPWLNGLMKQKGGDGYVSKI